MCFSCSIYSKLFAKIYDPFMLRAENRVLKPRRQRLLASLQGNILEVGCGTGINLPFYQTQAKIYALEPSPYMIHEAKKRLQETANRVSITWLESNLEGCVHSGILTPNSMDAIVCTLVLCSVAEPKSFLQVLKTLLKPGGRLMVIEHIKPSPGWIHSLAKAANPIWRKLAQGCNLDRQTDKLLQETGFHAISEEYFKLHLPFYQAELTLKP